MNRQVIDDLLSPAALEAAQASVGDRSGARSVARDTADLVTSLTSLSVPSLREGMRI